ncbi:DNA-binding transcriptional regulator, MarR family [Microbacterium azadirachtae]|uniref:DNA-binding transcriptional regulator, MarR family n=1 Tax=Microbacterium azadirachtae TaxID=582680 RepID=A0A1I6G8W1_9MICO|nr:MarR family transcriptional regulator [Microbacterium azadirachtae]SFR38642.1 DNA-binding transcriptional regulator, MarR family [Microbacterium azadirachtae]
MTESSPEGSDRAVVLAALADSGRELSTAVILFHANLSRRVGLGATEEKVLELVHRHGQVTVTELAAEAGMRKNSLSDTLDRLESKGFIQRQPHPDDGRKVSIVGTVAGRERIGVHFGDLMSRLNAINNDYTATELAIIAEYQLRTAHAQLAAAQHLDADTTSSAV